MSQGAVRTLKTERSLAAQLSRELAALDLMTVGDLAEKYLELFGEPTRTRNKQYLRKRLGWRIQERAEGGLSPRALAQIEALAPLAPPRWREHAGDRPTQPSRARDGRLPPAGTVLTRVWDGVEHEVKVLEAAFEYRGKAFKSLSSVAKQITGVQWNGFRFFFGDGETGAARKGGVQ